jgi:hypothetical protein
LRNISLKQCFLLVDYIYLDNEERVRFAQQKHEYLIEQVISLPESTIEGLNRSIRLNLIGPTKYVCWVLQQAYLKDTNNNDIFNYTDSYDSSIGVNISSDATILLNGHPRISFRDSVYFSYIQTFQHLNKSPSEGINMYSFSLYPEKLQPSGSCNMSKIENAILQIRVRNSINFQNQVKIRFYSIVNNILKIANGLSGLVFDNGVV